MSFHKKKTVDMRVLLFFPLPLMLTTSSLHSEVDMWRFERIQKLQ
jgi:hypothetical protein